jgi:hypothetical protein
MAGGVQRSCRAEFDSVLAARDERFVFVGRLGGGARHEARRAGRKLRQATRRRAVQRNDLRTGSGVRSPSPPERWPRSPTPRQISCSVLHWCNRPLLGDEFMAADVADESTGVVRTLSPPPLSSDRFRAGSVSSLAAGERLLPLQCQPPQRGPPGAGRTLSTGVRCAGIRCDPVTHVVYTESPASPMEN